LTLQLAAAGPGPSAGRLQTPLPLELLLLPARELFQLLRQFVDLLIAVLLLGALLHLVLIRELVELELERIRQVFGLLVLLAAPAAASASLRAHLPLVLQ